MNTPQDRLEIYQKMLELFQRSDMELVYGFCWAASNVTDQKYNFFQWSVFEEHLPELFALKPANAVEQKHWFPINQENKILRIELLKQAINLVQMKLSEHNNKPATRTDMWMTYEEYVIHQELMIQAEAKMLRQMGLGWLVDFCSKTNEHEMH